MSNWLFSDLEKTACNVYQFYALNKNEKKLFDAGAVSFPICLKRVSHDVVLIYVPNTVGKMYLSKVCNCMLVIH